MAYVRELILTDIASRAAGITIANGYLSDVSQVLRYPTEQDGDVVAQHFEEGTPLLFLFDGDPEDCEEEKDEWALWVLRPKLRGLIPSNAVNPSTVLNNLIGDVKRFVKLYRTDWHAQVIETRVTQISILPDLTKPHAGFDASLELRYETTESIL